MTRFSLQSQCIKGELILCLSMKLKMLSGIICLSIDTFQSHSFFVMKAAVQGGYFFARKEAIPMQKASSVKMVAVPLKEAEQLLELYRNVEAADAHFQRCQSDSFRQHIHTKSVKWLKQPEKQKFTEKKKPCKPLICKAFLIVRPVRFERMAFRVGV